MEYKEIFMDVIGYEGLYQVSNLGRVKGLPKQVKMPNGSLKFYTEYIKKSCISKTGYERMTLNKNGVRRNHTIHKLVYDSFIGIKIKKHQINHIDGNKLNNKINNLEYITASENIKHAFRIGLKKSFLGNTHANSKISRDVAIKIKYDHKNLYQWQVAEKYNVSQQLVGLIRSGKRWPHI
jgi:hypothetical protein